MALNKKAVTMAEGFERIDFHAHILPTLDHGSSNTDDSLRQIALLRDAQVSVVCATSHFYPHTDTLGDFLARRESSFKMLEEARADAPRPQMILGAEVLICEGMEDMEGLEQLCFEGTNILLLELPLGISSLSAQLYETVLAIRDKGIFPVLAHADRYPESCIEPFLEAGISVQLNAVSLTGLFKSKRLERWISDGYVVAVGSDYHFGYEDNLHAYDKLCAKRPELVKSIFERTSKLLYSAVRH